jgi:hypothetical protein
MATRIPSKKVILFLFLFDFIGLARTGLNIMTKNIWTFFRRHLHYCRVSLISPTTPRSRKDETSGSDWGRLIGRYNDLVEQIARTMQTPKAVVDVALFSTAVSRLSNSIRCSSDRWDCLPAMPGHWSKCQTLSLPRITLAEQQNPPTLALTRMTKKNGLARRVVRVELAHIAPALMAVAIALPTTGRRAICGVECEPTPSAFDLSVGTSSAQRPNRRQRID